MRDEQPIPLPCLEYRRPPRERFGRLIALGMIGLALLDLGNIRWAPRIVWNASASAPIGVWRVRPHTIVRVGDMVLAWAPARVRQFAAERQYLPRGVPLLKGVAARDGARVCMIGRHIMVDGRMVALRRATDQEGRPLPWWQGCSILTADQYFLLNAAPNSFDSRYFGPVDARAIIGKATPLWLR
jgi:conjugative transfer signal peptidase TraF